MWLFMRGWRVRSCCQFSCASYSEAQVLSSSQYQCLALVSCHFLSLLMQLTLCALPLIWWSRWWKALGWVVQARLAIWRWRRLRWMRKRSKSRWRAQSLRVCPSGMQRLWLWGKTCLRLPWKTFGQFVKTLALSLMPRLRILADSVNEGRRT